MEITEVRVSLRDNEGKRLKAYVTVTFDNSFVVRNIKIVEGNTGLFVAMPARKLKMFCPRCGKKVEVESRYCNHCGAQIPVTPRESLSERQATHQDLAHPINQEFRDYLQRKILNAYEAERASGGTEEQQSPAPENEAV